MSNSDLLCLVQLCTNQWTIRATCEPFFCYVMYILLYTPSTMNTWLVLWHTKWDFLCFTETLFAHEILKEKPLSKVGYLRKIQKCFELPWRSNLPNDSTRFIWLLWYINFGNSIVQLYTIQGFETCRCLILNLKHLRKEAVGFDLY